MESEENQNQTLIDNKYLVIEKLGSGGTANVYKVKELNSNQIYAAKVFKKSSNFLEKETSMLRLINNPSIINLVGEGEGPISKNGKLSSNKKYIILDYAEKGTLIDYIILPKRGFKEKYAKVIFKKILNGILECHRRGVCHRDIKLENILLDNKFTPKICDFGFATLIQGNDGSGILRTRLGTLSYVAPEILLKKGYNGIKADIFSLGPLLFITVTGKIGFFEANKKDPYYRLIIAKHYDEYWNKISSQMPETSQEIKNLFIKMISFDPKSRISIEEILENDPWLNELIELNNEQLAELDKEIYNEFLEREKVVLQNSSENIQVDNQNIDVENDEFNSRGIGDDDYFSLDLKLKYEKTGLNMKDYVKIEGEISPHKFMNALANMIKNNNECSIEAYKNTYKFLVNFEKKEEENENNIPELEELKELEEGDEANKEEDEEEEDED